MINSGGCAAALARPICVEKLTPPRLVNPLVGVGAEVVPLSLEQVGRQTGTAEAVVIGQGRGEGGYRYAV